MTLLFAAGISGGEDRIYFIFGAPRHFLKRTAATPDPSCLNSCLDPLGGRAPFERRGTPLAPSRTGPVRGRAVLSKARGNPPHSIQPEFKRLRRALLLYRNFMSVASYGRLPTLYSRSFRGSSPGSSRRRCCYARHARRRSVVPSPPRLWSFGRRRGRAPFERRGDPSASIARIGSTLGTSIARIGSTLVFLAKGSARSLAKGSTGVTPTPPCQQILDGIPLLALARRSTTSFACVGIYSRFLQGRSGRCANGIPRGPVVTNSL